MAYCTPEDLRRILGQAVDNDSAAVQDSCDAATRYIDALIGPRAVVDPPPPVAPNVKRAAMIVAVRVYRDPESPWGVVSSGGDDLPMYAKGRFPDVDALLMGERSSFGLG